MIGLRKIKTDPQHAGSLVPAYWEPIQIPPGQRPPRVLARHVASFNLCADDTPVITNGYDILALSPGHPTSLVRRDLVQTVVVL